MIIFVLQILLRLNQILIRAAADVVRNWLRSNRGTLEYLSVWEQIYNPNFKVFESEHFKSKQGY